MTNPRRRPCGALSPELVRSLRRGTPYAAQTCYRTALTSG
jgi:hypothetical protein